MAKNIDRELCATLVDANMYTIADLDKKIADLLSKGADPFVLTDVNSANKQQAFTLAIFFNNASAIRMFLNHAKTNNIKIGLHNISPAKITNANTKNYFQDACINSGLSIIQSLLSHAQYENTKYGFPTPYKILNEPIQMYGKRPYLTCLAEEIVCTISERSLLASQFIDNTVHGKEETSLVHKFLNEWKLYHDYSKERPDLSLAKPVPHFSGDIQLVWNGRLDVMNFLINKQLINLNDQLSSGVGFAAWLGIMRNLMKENDAAGLNEYFRKNIMRHSQIKIPEITSLSTPKTSSHSNSSDHSSTDLATNSSHSEENDNEKDMVITLRTTNMIGEMPVDFKVRVDIHNLCVIVEQAVEQQKEKSLRRHSSLDRLKTETAKLREGYENSADGMHQAAQDILNRLSNSNDMVIEFYNGVRDHIQRNISKIEVNRNYFVENNYNLNLALNTLQAAATVVDVAAPGASLALVPAQLFMSYVSGKKAETQAAAVFTMTRKEVHANEKIAVRLASESAVIFLPLFTQSASVDKLIKECCKKIDSQIGKLQSDKGQNGFKFITSSLPAYVAAKQNTKPKPSRGCSIM